MVESMSEKAIALVVRGSDWSETSRIVTLFTREFGRIRALAKGGRRLKSNFEVGFDLLTVCRVVFIRKASGGLDLLTEAHMAETFPALRTNLPSLYAGYYVAELLADGMQDYDPHAPLFDTALGTLRDLNKDPTPLPPPRSGEGEKNPPRFGEWGSRSETGGVFGLISRFELAWLREIGYGPQFDACAVCAGEFPVPWPPAFRVTYSPEAGGVVCPGCSPTVRDQRPLSTEARAELRELSRRIDTFEHSRELPPAVRREVRAILGWTVGSVLGRRPRMSGYVDGV
jgi:DNA repair protein RecO (recombination protein O)